MMPDKRLGLKLLGVCVALVIVLVFMRQHRAGTWTREAGLRVQADNVIERVEEFRKKYGKLPNRLGDLGIAEKLEGPIYYSRDSDSDYVVWYGQSLGESVTYYSKEKKWNK